MMFLQMLAQGRQHLGRPASNDRPDGRIAGRHCVAVVAVVLKDDFTQGDSVLRFQIQQSLLEEQLRGGAHGRELAEIGLMGRLGGVGQNLSDPFLRATQRPTGPSSFDLGQQGGLGGGGVSGPAIAARPPTGFSPPIGFSPQPGNIFEGQLPGQTGGRDISTLPSSRFGGRNVFEDQRLGRLR